MTNALGKAPGKRIKVIVNLDVATHHRFRELYAKTTGVSAAVRFLMEKHIRALDAKNATNREQEVTTQDTATQKD